MSHISRGHLPTQALGIAIFGLVIGTIVIASAFFFESPKALNCNNKVTDSGYVSSKLTAESPEPDLNEDHLEPPRPTSGTQAYFDDKDRLKMHQQLHDAGYSFDETEERFMTCAHGCFRDLYPRWCIRQCDESLPPEQYSDGNPKSIAVDFD